MKQALHRKYRPQGFDDHLIGQDHVKVILQEAVKTDQIAQAYLFTGPRGTGKTSTARILGRAINCEEAAEMRPCGKCDICIEGVEGSLTDLIEIDAASHGSVDDARDLVEKSKLAPTRANKKVYIIDAASHGSVDDARDLVEKSKLAPTRANKKVYIIDEVHMLSKAAFNALLKIIEEPPDHVHFIMATTEAHKVLDTIKSRCQRFDFHLVHEDVLVDHLKYVCDAEKFKYEDEALRIIVQHAHGSVRDSLSILEQVTAGRRLTVKGVTLSLGVTTSLHVQRLTGFLFEKKAKEAIELLNQIYSEGQDVYQLVLDVLDHLRALMIAEVHAPTGKQQQVFEMIDSFMKALEALRDPVIAQLPVEIAIVELCSGFGVSSAVVEKAIEPQKVGIIGTVKSMVMGGESGARRREAGESKVSGDEKGEKSEVSSGVTDGSSGTVASLDSKAIASKVSKMSLRPLVRMCQFQEHKGGVRVLVNSKMEKEKLEESENMQELANILADVNEGKLEVVIADRKEVSVGDVGSVFG